MTEHMPRTEVFRTRDLIGWDVIDPAGSKVGTVRDLLIDRTGTIRFLDVDFGLFRKHVLLPAEVLEWGESAMVLTGWKADQVKVLPAYNPDRPLTRAVLDEMERAHPRLYGEAPTAAPADGESRAVPLNQAKDFKLSGGAPDLRGWNVFGEDGERVGIVSEMLVDPTAMKVRYLAVDLADDLFLLEDDRHVLIPAEAADLRERGQDIWVKGLPARRIAELPAYTGGALDPLVEERVQAAFSGGDTAKLPPASPADVEPEDTVYQP